jgi:hypothetical protein
MNKIYIIIFFIILISLIVYFVPQFTTKQKEQPSVVEIEQPPIKLKEPPVVICPENNNDNYTFSTEAKLGKNIIENTKQFIKMFIRPIREMFAPLTNIITDTSKISPNKFYKVGNLNTLGNQVINDANLKVKNKGTTCSNFPSKIYIETI